MFWTKWIFGNLWCLLFYLMLRGELPGMLTVLLMAAGTGFLYSLQGYLSPLHHLF